MLEKFNYDNKIVRNFAIATVIWGLVGMLVGLLVAMQLFKPEMNLGNQYTTFGRIRPLHTNAVIFAFVGNGIFMGVYYSLQRLLKARMFSDILSSIHFWGWQLIIISAGFDAHREDDLGQMGLVEDDYVWITKCLKEVADQYAQGRIVSCLEGGYNLSALGRSVVAHVKALADI
jgi:uncharacterized protein YacL